MKGDINWMEHQDPSSKLGLTQADCNTRSLFTEPNSNVHLLEIISPSPKTSSHLYLFSMILSAVYLSYVSNRLYHPNKS